MSCSSSCPTRDHKTFGECMRSKNLQLKPNLSNTDRTKKLDSDLQRYRDVRAQGIQPDGTSASKVRKAEEMSQSMGQAYDATKPMFDVSVS